jgi:hypothetical protein
MITFFATAKPFKGHDGVIQRNALKSWKLLHPDVEVILFGDEEGAAEACRELGLRHEPHVEHHESGMKYLNYMFDHAQKIARHEVLCYSNCDIILLPDFRHAVEMALARKKFLLVAQRRDTDVTAPIDFSEAGWARKLREFSVASGILQDPNFIDFFVFPRGLYDEVPPMVVGRSYWDHWLVWKAWRENAEVVDGTAFLVAVHQNHGFGYHPQGKQGTHDDALALRNRDLAGKGSQLKAILDSTHCITRHGKIRRTPFRRKLSGPLLVKMRQAIVEKTFGFRKFFGLRKESLDRMLRRRTDFMD